MSMRTPGIRVAPDGNLIIDKEHRGVPIYARLGPTDQACAEERLIKEIRRVDDPLASHASRRVTFADCAGRYLSAVRGRKAVEVTAWHVRLLLPYIVIWMCIAFTMQRSRL